MLDRSDTSDVVRQIEEDRAVEEELNAWLDQYELELKKAWVAVHPEQAAALRVPSPEAAA